MAQLKSFLSGDKELIKTMEMLSHSCVTKIMRPAINEGLKPIEQEAKNLTTPGNILSKQATGLMRKAIKRKVVITRNGIKAIGKVYISRKIGDIVTWIEKKLVPSSKSRIGRMIKVEKYIEHYKHNPGMIAHLVEFGHGGPAPAPAHPFLRPALDNKKHQGLLIITNKARQLLFEVVAKYKTIGKRYFK